MYNYLSTNGGIETYIEKKSEFFSRQPNIEQIIIMPGKKNDVQKKGGLTLYTVCSKKMKQVDIFEMKRNKEKILDILKKESPDIIEVSQVYVLPEIAFAYAKINNIPVVNFYHTHLPYWVELTVPEFVGRKAICILQYIAMKKYRRIYNKFDSILVASNVLEEFLINQKVSNTRLVPFGVDLNMFNQNKKDKNFKREFNIDNDELILVYHGRFHKDKNIDVLIDSLEHLPKDLKIRLLLIGDQPQYSEIHKKINGNEKIILYPYTRNQNLLSRMLASSDIYVSASPFESFGLSLIEAQACGLPVVAMRGGGIPEVVPEISGELGEPNDPKGLAENILKIIKRGPGKVGAEARKFVEQNYSWDNTFTKLYILYLTLVKNKKVRKSLFPFKQTLQSTNDLITNKRLWQSKI
jgi:alpha-1,6-mannosyltransferase